MKSKTAQKPQNKQIQVKKSTTTSKIAGAKKTGKVKSSSSGRTSLDARFNAFDQDMKELKKNLRELGYMERPIGLITASWIYNLLLASVPAILFFYTDNWFLKALAAIAAGVGAVGIATSAHNFSHGNAYKTQWLNRFLDILGFSFLIGISSRFWDNFHNKLHHPSTSVVTIDPDTDILPWFALHEKQYEKAGSLAKLYYTRLQWLAFPFLVGGYVLMLQFMGWKYMLKKFANFGKLEKHDKKLLVIDVVAITGHYLFWIGLFSLFFPLSEIIILYLARFFVAGILCFLALAPTHYVRDALYFDEDILKINYYSRQMFSTINFEVGGGIFGSFLVNGVEYHLDHHLFPQVSPSLLKKIGQDVDKIARKHGMPHRSRSWMSIIIDAYKVIIRPKSVDNRLMENFFTN